ncbi:unnamed protein product [Psylliodes chrysocephalus]|uniref:DUF4371 domain-containing protein n=1 Tax=Psylliodes chrysocephalus TaxID=3402493 RepID=A0A9P0CRP0_9CUCU|nr:unnamed protein product [Psylliodes chrysocephala]
MDVYTSFKKYDYILNNKSLLLAEKIIVLLELWNKINKANEQLKQVNATFRERFEKLIHLVVNTWNNSTLEKLMKVSSIELTNEDIDFFNYEQAYVISVRLMKLCDCNCEDLALNLATAFLKYVESNNIIRISVEQIWFIFDVKISLLYKFKEKIKIEDILREMNYEDGIYLIKRFINKKPNLMKIWKYSPKIAMMAIHSFLEKIVTEHKTNLNFFNELLEMYIALSTVTDSLDHLSTKIKQLCEISNLSTLHSFCEYFKNVKNPKLKYCIVEIFIKTLTVYMNELELLKNKQDVENIKSVTSTLAEIFCGLAEYMNQKIKVARECVLTAFSLEPTSERLNFLEILADKSGLQGTSKTVQNDLLDSMLSIAQEQIKLEIQSAEYIAIQVDETTDSSNKTQMTFIVRYILSGIVHERFIKFIIPSGTTAEHLSDVIFKELEILEIHKTPEKLIGQSYDGASTMSGRLGGVQKKNIERYPAANFIHCYAHQLNLILQKAASQNKNVKIFFANLQGFSTFFSRSPKRTAVLDEFVKVRLPRAVPTRWYFNARCVETVFLYQVDILASLEKIIETEEDSNTID